MKDEIIRMAADSGMELYGLGKDREKFLFYLERFYNLAVQHERKAIANFIQHEYERQFEEPWRDNLCKQIRARGEK